MASAPCLGVSCWEQGVLLSRVSRQDDDKYLVESDCLDVKNAKQVEAVAAALRGSKLAPGVEYVFISKCPDQKDKAEYWSAMTAGIEKACRGATIVDLTHLQRECAVKVLTGRDIREEALQQMAGSSSGAAAAATVRARAKQYGTHEARQLYIRLSRLMQDASRDFLHSRACANSKSAYTEYIVGHVFSRGWFADEALWNAMYGAACANSTRGGDSSQSNARDGSERRKQQQQQQQRREQERRQQDERARQQHRQQQYQQARQAAAAAAAAAAQQLPADLSAAAPDVKAMSAAQLQKFLQELGVSADAVKQASQSRAEASSSSSSTDGGSIDINGREALLPLAERCLQLWEAKRLLRCGSHLSAAGATMATRIAYARMVFRLGSSSSSSSGGLANEVKESCKALCLAVHPDKIPVELRGFVGVSTDAFRVLQQAIDLVLGCGS